MDSMLHQGFINSKQYNNLDLSKQVMRTDMNNISTQSMYSLKCSDLNNLNRRRSPNQNVLQLVPFSRNQGDITDRRVFVLLSADFQVRERHAWQKSLRRWKWTMEVLLLLASIAWTTTT